MMRQWCHLYRGDYDDVLALKARVLRTMEQQFHLRWYVWMLSPISWPLSCLGRWQDATAEAQKALRTAEEFADRSIMSFAAWLLTVAYTCQGDLRRAVESGQQTVQHAPTPTDKAWSAGFLVWACGRAGAPHQGIEMLTQGVEANRAADFAWGETLFAVLLGEVYW
jgi:tetratricopeptide (TPR) repeat protein